MTKKLALYMSGKRIKAKENLEIEAVIRGSFISAISMIYLFCFQNAAQNASSIDPFSAAA